MPRKGFNIAIEIISGTKIIFPEDDGNNSDLFICFEFQNMAENIFNVRVYGILINEQGQVLVTDEIHYGQRMTKFPGGGLQFGEGIVDCLKRECVEELGLEVNVQEHFYTTDFFQLSAFNPKHQ